MTAYMNYEAFKLTCETGYMHYYSRSRKACGRKARLRVMSRESTAAGLTATEILCYTG